VIAVREPKASDVRRAARLDVVVRNGEVAVYGVLTVLGAAAAVAAPSYGLEVEGNRVGPGLLPFVAGVLVAVLCGAALVQAARRVRTPEAAVAPAEDVDVLGRDRAQRLVMLRMVFGLLLATLLLVQVLGLLLAFGLFVVAVSTVVERRPLWAAVAIAALAVAVLYGVFVEFLTVPLPRGPLGLG